MKSTIEVITVIAEPPRIDIGRRWKRRTYCYLIPRRDQWPPSPNGSSNWPGRTARRLYWRSFPFACEEMRWIGIPTYQIVSRKRCYDVCYTNSQTIRYGTSCYRTSSILDHIRKWNNRQNTVWVIIWSPGQIRVYSLRRLLIWLSRWLYKGMRIHPHGSSERNTVCLEPYSILLRPEIQARGTEKQSIYYPTD